MHVVIRPAAPSDDEDLLKAHYAAVHGTASADYDAETCRAWSAPVTAERLAAYRRQTEAEGEVTVVAVADGRVVGFAAIVPGLSELRAVYVSPEAGRQGVGRRLLGAVESMAREAGLRELHMDSSLTAERFYLERGYSSEGRAEHTLRNGARMVCVRMRKSL